MISAARPNPNVEVAAWLVHGFVYLTGAHAMRSLVWLGGFACVLGLMASAAMKVAG